MALSSRQFATTLIKISPCSCTSKALITFSGTCPPSFGRCNYRPQPRPWRGAAPCPYVPYPSSSGDDEHSFHFLFANSVKPQLLTDPTSTLFLDVVRSLLPRRVPAVSRRLCFLLFLFLSLLLFFLSVFFFLLIHLVFFSYLVSSYHPSSSPSSLSSTSSSSSWFSTSLSNSLSDSLKLLTSPPETFVTLFVFGQGFSRIFATDT